VTTIALPALALLRDARVVPVVRASTPEKALAAAHALARGGCRVVEVAFTVPQAAQVIAELAGAGVPVGAGTVLDEWTAREALDAGARFLVSPHLDPAVLGVGHAEGALVIPGVLTPNEVVAARRAGASLLKIFPVESVGGPRYLKLLRDPFPELSFFPTGGVTLEDAPRYLANGAIAVGAASALLDPRAVEAGDTETIEASARRWCEALGVGIPA
jgi:2-dehydro-3-deoxyphosphogluconate aldolase/(4S)-4-hydroxy-2-oxoglutarate aldolase